MVGVHFSRSDATEATRYFVKDHLGSVAVLTDEAGAVAERLAYDAWGKRRYPNGTDDTANILTASTIRGFTGHEMVDEVDLIDMNGRVYDPALGRFMSADPFIHDVTNTQDLNRYSYVHNNPLSFVDQNGYGFFKSIGKFFKKILKPLLAIAVAILIIHFGPVAFGANPGAIIGGAGAEGITLGQGAIIAGVAGGTSNVILTGKPKAFLTGFAQGAFTAGIGSAFNCNACLGKAISHGVVSGAFAEAQGGKFSAGFLSAGFSTLAGGLGDLGNKWSNSAFRAAVGGTAAILGGGKFADGATAAAFAYLFNGALHPRDGIPAKIDNNTISMKTARGFAYIFSKVQSRFGNDAVTEVADAFKLLDRLGVNIFTAGGGGTYSQGVGGTASEGFYVDTKTGSYGGFGSVGLSFGTDRSYGLFALGWRGPLSSFFGPSIVLEADFNSKLGGGSIAILGSGYFDLFGDILDPGPNFGLNGGGVAIGLGGGLGVAGSVVCTFPLQGSSNAEAVSGC